MSEYETLEIKVIPSAKKNLVKEEAGSWKVYLTAPAVEGKANEALLKILSGHLALKKSQLEIIKGLKSRHKIIKIIRF